MNENDERERFNAEIERVRQAVGATVLAQLADGSDFDTAMVSHKQFVIGAMALELVIEQLIVMSASDPIALARLIAEQIQRGVAERLQARGAVRGEPAICPSCGCLLTQGG